MKVSPNLDTFSVAFCLQMSFNAVIKLLSAIVQYILLIDLLLRKFQWFCCCSGEDPGSEWGDAAGCLWTVPGQEWGWNTTGCSGDTGGSSESHHGLHDCGGDLQRQEEVQQGCLRGEIKTVEVLTRVECCQVASSDLVNMGITVVSYTLKDIRDEEGYLKALGLARTAEVKRDARIGEAEAR